MRRKTNSTYKKPRSQTAGIISGREVVLSVEEYRRLTGDIITPDEKILERIEYLTFFTRKVARDELEKYVKNYHKN